MKYIIILLILTIITFPKDTLAIYDPTSLPNNKIGIHILFPDEIENASELVNSSGGDWGYVTIPIQAGDKDIFKWQKFMDNAKKFHLIPIIRLATEGDYFQKESWRKPNFEDVLDFANFLDSLNWPVKNRYVIVFNEVNRADEWEGVANPNEYAQILAYTSNVFKSKNQDYFIISSGMDNAAITSNGTYSQYDFFENMNFSIPGIFDQIDGFSSHSYPNPAFSQPPTKISPTSIYSYKYEKDLISQISSKDLPIFITETGWDQQKIGESITANYFKIAIENIWTDPKIIAITPFLLKAGSGPFEKFSFMNNDGNKNQVFKTVASLSKVKGTPSLNEHMPLNNVSTNNDSLPVEDYSLNENKDSGNMLKSFVKWLLFPI